MAWENYRSFGFLIGQLHSAYRKENFRKRTVAKIASLNPDVGTQEKESFIKRPYRRLSHWQKRNEKYYKSQRFYDRFLTKFENCLERNNIPFAVFCFFVIIIVFGFAFLCVISFIANNQQTIKPHFKYSHSSSMQSPSDKSMNANIIKKIKILLISDIHLNKSNVEKVHKYVKAHKIKLDHLWAPGDFLKMKESDNDDEKKVIDGERDLIDLLAQIRQIHPLQVIIPGNHDPKTLFLTETEKYFKFGGCVNVHNKVYKVENESNLYLAGFGGSVPAMCENKVFWKGFPYQNEEEFGKEYNAFIEEQIVKNKELAKKKKSVILLTHNGPSQCSTTMDWRHNDQTKVIECGSSNIMKSLLNEEVRERVICNIHGHTHLGVGQGHIGKDIAVINPGSLKGGDFNHNFALLELAQLKDQTWKVHSVQFKNTKDL